MYELNIKIMINVKYLQVYKRIYMILHKILFINITLFLFNFIKKYSGNLKLIILAQFKLKMKHIYTKNAILFFIITKIV